MAIAEAGKSGRGQQHWHQWERLNFHFIREKTEDQRQVKKVGLDPKSGVTARAFCQH